MNITIPVAQQAFIMLCLIIVGAILYKSKTITEKGTKDMSGILLTIVTPCVLIKSYQIDCSSELIKEIGISFLFSMIIQTITIIFVHLLFHYQKDKHKKTIELFASIYSNCGFMGIPLLQATVGDKGVLLGSAYLAIFNITVWTHGLLVFSKNPNLLSIKNIIKNPGIIGTTIALLLFFTNIRLPNIVMKPIGYIAELNTPLAMILLGAYLARISITSSLTNTAIYITSFVKLILIPVIAILIFKISHTDKFLATSIILATACPCATISALFAEKFDMDTGFPSQVVSISTILSVLTLPFISYLSSIIL